MIFLPLLIKRVVQSACLLLIIIFFVSGCFQHSEKQQEESTTKPPIENGSKHELDPLPSMTSDESSDEQPIMDDPEPYVTEARLVAVGDIMMHSPQIPAAYDVTTDTYRFDGYFTHVKPELEGDWVIANLETPLAGKDAGGYSGYPMFNAPESLADAIRNAGFNIVTTANNHAMDRYEQGVLHTLKVVKDRGLIPVGTYESQNARNQIEIVENNGISMAFLAYTYGTNGIPIPENKPYLVNVIDEVQIMNDIQRARAKADVITVSLHFGQEYHRQPSEQQISLAHQLIRAGADIILGSHPHVVQPYEMIEVENDTGVPRKGVVIYSLGNFISNQGPDQGTAKYTDVGVIFSVNVKKHMPEETIEIDIDKAVPTWVHKYWENGKRQYRILPIEAVTVAKTDAILTQSQYALLDDYLEEMEVHLESLMPHH